MNKECNGKTCPWQGGSSLAGAWRKIIHDPDAILGDYIKNGMWILDAGCGMGYMSLAAARTAGEQGRVLLVDIQPEMLKGAMERMCKAGFEQRAVAVQCRQRSLCIDEYAGMIDFAYAFMMIHETDDKAQVLTDLYASLKPGGSLLIAEPYIHVSKQSFLSTLECAEKAGFEPPVAVKRRISLCRAAIMKKPV